MYAKLYLLLLAASIYVRAGVELKMNVLNNRYAPIDNSFFSAPGAANIYAKKPRRVELNKSDLDLRAPLSWPHLWEIF